MNIRKLVASTFTLIIILSIVGINTGILLRVSATPEPFKIISVNTMSFVGEPKIYPGSKRVSLILEVINNKNQTVYNVQGCLDLPEGILPSQNMGKCVNAVSPNGIYINSIDPGEVFQFRYLLDINKSLSPGTYVLGLTIYYSTSNLTDSERFTYKTNVNIMVSDYPQVKINILDLFWSSYDVYPGSASVTLNLLIENAGDSNIQEAWITFEFPDGFYPTKSRYEIGYLAEDDNVLISLTGIDIDPNIEPGTYMAYMKINATATTSDGVEYKDIYTTSVALAISEPPTIRLKLIDSGWVQDIAYSNSRSLDAYVTMQNTNQVSIDTIVATLILPENVTARDSSNKLTTVFQGPISYGNVFTLTFRNINISTESIGKIVAELMLSIKASRKGADFWLNETYNVTFTISEAENVLQLVAQRWLYGTSVATALPSAENIVLELTLLNVGQNTLASIAPTFQLPNGFVLKDLGGSCLNTGVQPGYTCNLLITLDIDYNVQPGPKELTIELFYAVSIGGSYLYNKETITSYIYVDDPNQFKPRIQLLSINWGRTEPSTEFPGSRIAPIYVELINMGRYTASDVVIDVNALNESIKVLEGKSLCSNTLLSGSTCRTILYFDLGNAISGKLLLDVRIRYVVKIYGAFVEYVNQEFDELDIEKFAAVNEQGLQLVSHDWLNSQPVFPGTENATYVIRLANSLPFSVAGIELNLILPNKFRAREGTVATNYISGPIQSLQELTTTFVISVGNVTPGKYTANLSVSYVVLTGGASIKRTDNFTLEITINSIEHGIEYVTSGWYGASPEPGTYGSILFMIFRNVDFPAMNGIVAEVELPQGIVASVNNRSKVTIVPSYVGESIPITAIPQFLTQAIQPTITASRGDFIVISLPVNILNVSLGTHIANVTFTFIDHWGNFRSFKSSAIINMLGGSKVIEISTNSTLKFTGREGYVIVELRNVGSSPIYNLYVMIYPTVPNLVVRKSLYYIESIGAGSTKTINVSVYFNPVPSYQTPIPITYGSVPFVATIMFRDISGYQHSLNTTFSVIVEPFVYVELSDVKVTQRGSEIRASGTITNLGSATAQRMEAILAVGTETSKTFIGDVDPSSQTSFSITLYYPEKVNEVQIVIRYRNAYNELEEMKYTFYVEYEEVTTTPPPSETPFDLGKIIVVLGVVVFLVIVALVIRSYLKRHPVPEFVEGAAE